MRIPGLVDLQVNGFKGVDFSGEGLREDDFRRCCGEVCESGTSGFLATVITSRREVYRENLAVMVRVMDEGEFAGRLLGIHLEGPFISREDGARGAHRAEWVSEADSGYLRELLEWGGGYVRLLTLAAEIAGSEELAEIAVEAGVAVSLGHQMAGREDIDRLVKAGARGLTHLGNGVPAMVDRHENPIWAGLGNDELYAMMITDGHHLPAEVIKTFVRAKGAERIIVVSDVSPIGGLGPGRYEALGNEVVLAESGRLYNPETGYMVGSSATMLECMNHLAGLGVMLAEGLVKAGFYNPLRLTGVDEGQVKGARAVLYDEEKREFVAE
jgi:N-acetylglucosamine-6-phosphate deacetylase